MIAASLDQNAPQSASRASQTHTTYSYDAIPEELKQRPQWVVWRLQNGKKIPFTPGAWSNGPVGASHSKPNTWRSFADALKAYTASQRSKSPFDGIGFVFSADDPFCGLDFDDCIDASGQIAPGVQMLLDELHTYAEISQSGRGVKAIVRAKLPAAGIRGGAYELYDQRRFFALTGRAVEQNIRTLANGQAVIDRLAAGHTNKASGLADSQAGQPAGIDMRFVGWLRKHKNRLFDAHDLPHGLKVNHPAARELRALIERDELPAALAARNNSASERRALVVGCLARLGYDAAERYTIAYELIRRFGYDSNKTDAELETDIVRLVHYAKYQPKQISKSSIDRKQAFERDMQRGTCYEPQAAPERQHDAPKKRQHAHQPRGGQAANLDRLRRMFEQIADDGVLHGYSIADLTDEFNRRFRSQTKAISERTMQNYMRLARLAEWLVAEPDDHGGRWIYTLKVVICTPPALENRGTYSSGVQAVATAQTADEQTQCIEDKNVHGCISVSDQADQAYAQHPTTVVVSKSIGDTPTFLDMPRLSLSALMQQAFDAVAEQYERLNIETGEIVRGVVNQQRIYDWIAQNGGSYDPKRIAVAYQAEQQRRRKLATARQLDKLREKARNLSISQLKKASQAAAATFARALNKQDTRAAFYQIRSNIYAAEEARRAELDTPGELELFALADHALNEIRKERENDMKPRKKRNPDSQSSQPDSLIQQPQQRPDSRPDARSSQPDARGLIERLKARKAAEKARTA